MGFRCPVPQPADQPPFRVPDRGGRGRTDHAVPGPGACPQLARAARPGVAGVGGGPADRRRGAGAGDAVLHGVVLLPHLRRDVRPAADAAAHRAGAGVGGAGRAAPAVVLGDSARRAGRRVHGGVRVQPHGSAFGIAAGAPRGRAVRAGRGSALGQRDGVGAVRAGLALVLVGDILALHAGAAGAGRRRAGPVRAGRVWALPGVRFRAQPAGHRPGAGPVRLVALLPRVVADAGLVVDDR